MGSFTEGSRAYTVTSTDHGGELVIAATMLMVWSILCWLIRMYTRFGVNGPFGWDDSTITVATVSLIQCRLHALYADLHCRPSALHRLLPSLHLFQKDMASRRPCLVIPAPCKLKGCVKRSELWLAAPTGRQLTMLPCV